MPMKRLHIAIVIFCLLFSIDAKSQTEQQIKNELEKRGINTYEEVQAELRKRGMTEADARRQARLYGINYDEYLKKYILAKANQEEALEPVTSITLDTVDYTTELTDEANQIIPQDTLKIKEPQGLPYFGYDIFTNNPYANQQALVGNIDPGYIIGPGDELRVYLWGEAEFQFEGKVDINGNLFIPNVGQVFVSGVTYQSLHERLKQYLSRFYSGLVKSPPAIFLDVSLTKLRPIRVMVMGESKNPGSLMINSFATTLNSIYASGGIKTTGSLREVKVFRNNRFISTIDLYDYLIKGAVSEDIRLMSNDVIFIQSRMNAISIEGEVNREGIYELKGNEGLIDLIGFAGGLKPTAHTQSVTIKRIRPLLGRSKDNSFDREIITINYNDLLLEGVNFRLQDGDQILFDKVLDKFDNMVTIAGSVFRPGDYQYTEGMSVADLIGTAGGLRPNTYFEKVDLFRRDRSGELRFLSLNLTEVLGEGSQPNFQLQPDDSLKVYNTQELKTLETVSIEGFLSKPKTVLWRENLSLYDLIFMSANVEDLEYKNRILTSRADLLRYQEGKTEYQVIPFNLDEVLDKKFNAVLKPRDRVILYSRDINEVLDSYVTIRGAVKNEGRYALTDDMTVEDLILQAGGFVRTAFRDSVTVSRENFDFSGNMIAQVRRVPTNMDYLLGATTKPDGSYILQHNDNITVDLIPGSSESREVKLSGEIKFPGNYFLRSKEETLKEVITRAGGISPNAYLPGAKFYRDGKQLALSIDDLMTKQNEAFNIVLQPNDSIYIPESFYTVKVEGEVANPSLQKYQLNQGVKAYIRNAGGRTKNAHKIYITSSNGFTRKVGWLSNPKVLDGSIITVSAKPPKKEREPGKFLENFGTLAAIISSTLTTIYLVERLN
ncbi:sugar ABC transporter substrate-binding protein [Roseivirga thermotolerans]|uniref:Sugar ABC transporter substrate-binding protein n=2 Tax=Roseivirga thermotolerans TaxID=1758176 RepID=A0ABQ3I3U9_9BACT|nr:sugar ABC transporter substrate-binding protein [Roseivirga thermotolerans]